jgi:protein subunit release factor B
MQLLFSLTKKDFEIETFRCGGKGGQNVNKVETGVRIYHRASGAVGRAVDTRHQAKNRVLAFQRCVSSKEFKNWHKAEVARRLGLVQTVEQAVDKMMSPENLKIEVY